MMVTLGYVLKPYIGGLIGPFTMTRHIIKHHLCTVFTSKEGTIERKKDTIKRIFVTFIGAILNSKAPF